MTFLLEGEVAVVTGAARGIGRASAIALAKAGADVVGIDIVAIAGKTMTFAPATPEDLETTGQAVEATGRRWLGLTLDQRDIGAIREAAKTITSAFGGVDILHANAGIQHLVIQKS